MCKYYSDQNDIVGKWLKTMQELANFDCQKIRRLHLRKVTIMVYP